MSVSTYDFGDGMKYVECTTYDEVEDVIQFLMDAGYGTGDHTPHRLAQLVAQTYPYVGVSEYGNITGWTGRRGKPVMSYADFVQRYKVRCVISDIDDLL